MPMSTATANEIRVLSIRQQWAGLIMSGQKIVENRSWSTKYRGRIFIHASRWEPIDRTWIEEHSKSPERARTFWNDRYKPGTTGLLLGSVELVDVVEVFDMEMLQQTPVGQVPKRRHLEESGGKAKAMQILEQHAPGHAEVAKMSNEDFNLFVCGDFCWILRDPKLFRKPIPMLGKLGLFRATLADKIAYA